MCESPLSGEQPNLTSLAVRGLDRSNQSARALLKAWWNRCTNTPITPRAPLNNPPPMLLGVLAHFRVGRMPYHIRVLFLDHL